jgi:hypothetical protein
METSPEPTRAFESLDGVIADYLQQVEARKAPDRAAILAAHPEVADRLRAFFGDFDRMGKQASALRLPAAEQEEAEGSSTRIRYVGDYELLSEIARGGMGIVFKARQVSLNRVVAVKMILAGAYATPVAVQRFRAEAEAAANLDHPNILPIYEIGEHEGHQYFSMKLIEGPALNDSMAAYHADPQRAAMLMATLARAVHFAHQRGILHRDLKPSNILLDADGTPYVTDFGLAKKVDGDDLSTRTGTVVGTPSYMAPEQARGEKGLSMAIDVYSLGAILYELLTGRPPFRCDSVLETLRQVTDVEPTDPRNWNAKADRDLAAIAMKCLEKNPARRYESAMALAEDLERWQAGEPTKARPPSLAGLAWRWLRRNAATAAWVLGLGVFLGIFAIVGLFAVVPTKLLVPSGASPLNPLVWFHVAETQPSRGFVLALTAALVFGFGWMVHWIIRPTSERSALAAGGAISLIASLIVASMVAPVFTVGMSSMPNKWTRAHPLIATHQLHRVGQNLWDDDFPPEDAAYLKQFLHGDGNPNLGEKDALRDLQSRAIFANHIFSGMIIGWSILAFVTFFLVGLALSSTWAADHVARSGRGPWACFVCYFEVYLPTVFFVLWLLIVMGITVALSDGNHTGAPTWFMRLLPLLGIGAIMLVAFLGVTQRWRWWIRAAVYAGGWCAIALLLWMWS